MVFADPARRAFCQEWERAAHSCVAELRAAYGQDPASPRSSRNSPATPGRSPVCGAYTRPRASRGRASACATRRWATCTSGSPPSRSTAPRTSNSSSTRRSRPVRRPRRSRGCGPPGASSPPVVTRRQVRLHTRGLSSRHADPGWGTRAVLSKAAPQKEPLCSGSITSTTCLGRSPGARAGPVGTATAVEPLARPTSPTYFSPRSLAFRTRGAMGSTHSCSRVPRLGPAPTRVGRYGSTPSAPRRGGESGLGESRCWQWRGPPVACHAGATPRRPCGSVRRFTDRIASQVAQITAQTSLRDPCSKRTLNLETDRSVVYLGE